MVIVRFKEPTTFSFGKGKDTLTLDHILARFVIKDKKSNQTQICTNEFLIDQKRYLRLHVLNNEIKSIYSHFEINRTR